jgi:hypothetical protein
MMDWCCENADKYVMCGSQSHIHALRFDLFLVQYMLPSIIVYKLVAA